LACIFSGHGGVDKLYFVGDEKKEKNHEPVI
jgi:hypothetical protein